MNLIINICKKKLLLKIWRTTARNHCSTLLGCSPIYKCLEFWSNKFQGNVLNFNYFWFQTRKRGFEEVYQFFGMPIHILFLLHMIPANQGSHSEFNAVILFRAFKFAVTMVRFFFICLIPNFSENYSGMLFKAFHLYSLSIFCCVP